MLVIRFTIYSIKGAQLKKSVLLKLVCKLFLITSGLILVVFFHRMLIYGVNVNNISYLHQRLAQNGQVWWKLYAVEKEEQTHISEDELGDETNIFFRFDDAKLKEHNSGMQKMMRKVTPISIFLKKCPIIVVMRAQHTQQCFTILRSREC